MEFGEPVVHGGEEGKARAAEDGVVEVTDDELSVVNMDVGGGGAENQSLMPLVTMWCPQTSEPAEAMAMLEKAIIL